MLPEVALTPRCGGDIEYLPCSHVGHIFRTPQYWQGQVYKVPGEEINRNKLRTAEVWMDEFQSLVKFASGPLPASLPIGDLEPRKQLRKKLHCKDRDFRWYLQVVTPNLFVPKITAETKGGALRNQVLDACRALRALRVLNSKKKRHLKATRITKSKFPGEAIGAYPCHGQHGTQAFVEDKSGLMRVPQLGYKMCLSHEGNVVADSDSRLHWRLDDMHLKSSAGKCMQVTDAHNDKSPFTLTALASVNSWLNAANFLRKSGIGRSMPFKHGTSSAILMILNRLRPFHFLQLALAFSNVIADEETCTLALHKSLQSVHRTYTNLASGLRPHPDENCDSEVGLGRLKRYQLHGEEFCSTDSASVSFSCAASWLNRSSGVAKADDYICRAKGMKAHLPGLSELRPIEMYGAGGGCHWNLPKDGLQLQFYIFSHDVVSLSLLDGKSEQPCDIDTGSRPLLLFSDSHWWNPYINQAQAIMAYVSIAALDVDPKELQLIRMPRGKGIDGASRDGPMKGLHSLIFSQGAPAIELKKEAQMICTDNLIVPTGGRKNFIRKNIMHDDPWAAQCTRAPLLRGYGAFVRESLQVPFEKSRQSQFALRITLIPRHSSTVWPLPYQREMENSEDVATALRKNEFNRLSFVGDPDFRSHMETTVHMLGARVQEVQLETLSIPEQANAIANTDILIGPHGAALSWMMVLPPCAQVLESCALGMFQFGNYAKLMGIDHVCVEPSIDWGSAKFNTSVANMVQEAAAAKRRRYECLLKRREMSGS
eukprot:s1631_g2.t1